MSVTTPRRRAARRTLGSLGIVGAAAAVAGMGTFATFTDSTAPLDASLTSGTLSLDLNAAHGTATLPMNAAGFVAGDSISRSVDLVNSGDLGFAGLSLNSVATASSVLDTDKVNGLQLSVRSCSVSWTESVTAGVATYTCGGTTSTILSGAAVTTSAQSALASVNPGGRDHLVVTLTLPASAGNTFQGKSSALSVSFTGTQRSGTNR